VARRIEIKTVLMALLTCPMLLACPGTVVLADDGGVDSHRVDSHGVDSHILLQTSPLAGFQYHAGRALFPLFKTGDPVTLIREPENPHDSRAVRVEWRGVTIGFAPRADNVDLARIMDRGTPVEGRIVHLQKSRDPWKRVLLDILIRTVRPEQGDPSPSPE